MDSWLRSRPAGQQPVGPCDFCGVILCPGCLSGHDCDPIVLEEEPEIMDNGRTKYIYYRQTARIEDAINSKLQEQTTELPEKRYSVETG